MKTKTDLVLRSYTVTTTIGSISVMATSVPAAIKTALELIEGDLLSCLLDPEW